MNIGKSIKLAAVHKGMTHGQIAAHIGVSGAYMSSIANNHKTPNMQKISSIASCVDMKVSEFIALGEA